MGVSVACIAVALSMPARLPAQEPAPKLEGLHPGQFVRARTHDGRQVQGYIVSLTQDPPSLELSEHSIISLASTDSLWVRGSGAGSGALIAGGLLGLTSALVAYQACTKGGGEPVCTGAVVIGAGVAGAVLGAAVGAALGSTSVRWRLVFLGSPAKVGLGVLVPL